MIAKRLRADFENKSVEEIVTERNKIIKLLNEYEEKFVFNDSKDDPSLFVKPSPSTVYKFNNEDLIMLTELITEKIKEKGL